MSGALSSRTGRTVMGLIAPVAVILGAEWFDRSVLGAAQREVSTTFTLSPMIWAAPAGYLLVAAGVLAIGLVAWWAHGLVVGIAYVIVGGLLTFLFTLLYTSAVRLPSPLPEWIGQVLGWVQAGPMQPIYPIGASMLLGGVAAIWLSVREWRGPADPPVLR
jgi:hypothetical protein